MTPCGPHLRGPGKLLKWRWICARRTPCRADFGCWRLATFRRKNAIFEILRGEQKMAEAAVVGGLGFSTRGRKRGWPQRLADAARARPILIRASPTTPSPTQRLMPAGP